MGWIGESTTEDELRTITPWSDRAPPITDTERASRIERARRLTRDMGADAVLIGAGASLRRGTGQRAVRTLARSTTLAAVEAGDSSNQRETTDTVLTRQ